MKISYPVFSTSNRPPADFDYDSGAVFLLDKPKSWSSFDVVKYIRIRIKAKVGHAGTLDPMATGLLVACCGKATKAVRKFQDLPKEYRAVIQFGAATPSYDAETDIEATASFDHITEDMVRQVMAERFSGEIEQVPPMYSALKHKGKRLYKLARKGKEVKRHPRRIVIHSYEIVDFQLPVVTLDIRCSKGTYIRSIAHDLGKALDSLAYLKALTRTAIGPYLNSDAFTIEEFNKITFS